MYTQNPQLPQILHVVDICFTFYKFFFCLSDQYGMVLLWTWKKELLFQLTTTWPHFSLLISSWQIFPVSLPSPKLQDRQAGRLGIGGKYLKTGRWVVQGDRQIVTSQSSLLSAQPDSWDIDISPARESALEKEIFLWKIENLEKYPCINPIQLSSAWLDSKEKNSKL